MLVASASEEMHAAKLTLYAMQEGLSNADAWLWDLGACEEAVWAHVWTIMQTEAGQACAEHRHMSC